MSIQNQKIVSVYSYKGGVGKSTLSLSLASALQARSLDVAMLDIDEHSKTATDIAADGLLPFPVDSVQLSPESATAQVIVIDHPPHSSAKTGADLLVLPVVPARGAVKAMQRTLEDVDAGVSVLVAINEITASSAEREAIGAAIEELCNVKGLPFVRIRKRSAHEAAQNHGGTVYQKAALVGVSRQSAMDAKRDIEAFADAVCKQLDI